MNKKITARKIRSLMYLHGVTNAEIARRRDVSRTWVSLVIHGKGTSRPIQAEIARAVGVPIEDLWDEKKRKAA